MRSRARRNVVENGDPEKWDAEMRTWTDCCQRKGIREEKP